MQGKIKWFDIKKGFGFISCDEGNELFVHISEFTEQTPKDGDTVEYEVGNGRKGPCAIKVTIL